MRLKVLPEESGFEGAMAVYATNISELPVLRCSSIESHPASNRESLIIVSLCLGEFANKMGEDALNPVFLDSHGRGKHERGLKMCPELRAT